MCIHADEGGKNSEGGNNMQRNKGIQFDIQFFAEGGDGGEPGTGATTAPAAKTFSQDEVNNLVAERLKREREKYADYDELKKVKGEWEQRQKADMTELERLKAQLAEKEQAVAERDARLKAHEVRGIRVAALVAAGLPADLADRILGESEEDVKKDVEAFRASLGTVSKSIGAPSNPGSGGKTATDEGREMAEQRNKQKPVVAGGHDPWSK